MSRNAQRARLAPPPAGLRRGAERHLEHFRPPPPVSPRFRTTPRRTRRERAAYQRGQEPPPCPRADRRGGSEARALLAERAPRVARAARARLGGGAHRSLAPVPPPPPPPPRALVRRCTCRSPRSGMTAWATRSLRAARARLAGELHAQPDAAAAAPRRRARSRCRRARRARASASSRPRRRRARLAIVAEKLGSALHANPTRRCARGRGCDRYDDNGDKRLDVKEFVKMMRHATDADPPGLAIDRKTVPDDELRQIWTTADKDRSGTLVFQEFADFLAVCQEAHGKEFIATKIHRGPEEIGRARGRAPRRSRRGRRGQRRVARSGDGPGARSCRVHTLNLDFQRSFSSGCGGASASRLMVLAKLARVALVVSTQSNGSIAPAAARAAGAARSRGWPSHCAAPAHDSKECQYGDLWAFLVCFRYPKTAPSGTSAES